MDLMTATPSATRRLVAKLAASADGGLLTVRAVARVLGRPTKVSSNILGALTRQGWLRRVRPGLYFIPPLETSPETPTTISDPWLLAAKAFAPCYVGGWTAAEHWGLTEQIFRSTFVVSAAHLRKSSYELLGAEYHVVRVPPARVGDVATVWRETQRIAVSSRERTLADALISPGWVGGVRHLVEMLSTYRDAKEFAPALILDEMMSLGRGAGFKRLGYLAEQLWPGEEHIINTARQHLSKGVIKLDPAVKVPGRLNKKWGLWINVTIDREGGED